ncbi:MAG: glycosyltransferase family 4 protein, partial [Thermoplasmata archaeon]|nr:glycosyltransferase family 4 protein [Thermoplasmata archaeon]
AQVLAEGAVRRGHRVTMITQAEPGVPDREVVGGVEVVRLPIRLRGGIRFPTGYHAALRATRGDVFHLHGNRIWCADFYLPFARRFGWAQLGTGHGFYQYENDPKPWDRWYFERYFPWALSGLDVYACDTEHERRQLLGWGVPESRLRRLPLGIPLGEFSGGNRSISDPRAPWGFRAPHVAVYVGGFFPNKRVDRLIDAVAGTHGQWALLAIGRDLPGTAFDSASCAERARRAGIEYRATGPRPRPEVVAAIRAADAIVLGSSYEGFGVTLAEALAAGKPFVAFPAGAAPEIAASGGGEVVSTVAGFTSALDRLNDPAERARRGAAARAAAPEWSDETMLDRYLSVYEQLVAARRGAAGYPIG